MKQKKYSILRDTIFTLIIMADGVFTLIAVSLNLNILALIGFFGLIIIGYIDSFE